MITAQQIADTMHDSIIKLINPVRYDNLDDELSAITGCINEDYTGSLSELCKEIAKVANRERE